MCKLGDIIVIDKHLSLEKSEINKHSFVVINDQPGFIEGLPYDFVANVMSSFKSKKHRLKKLKFEENIEVISNEIISKSKNNKRGYIKADQINYFNKSKIKYYVLGHISDELLQELICLVIALDKKEKLTHNINNL